MAEWLRTLNTEYASLGRFAMSSPQCASAAAVRALETRLGVTFHSTYREFLLFCGENHGGLFRSSHADTTFAGIASFYEDFAEAPKDYPPPPWSVLGVSDVDIDLLINNNTGEVWTGSYGDVDAPLCESFELLVRQEYEWSSLLQARHTLKRSWHREELPPLGSGNSSVLEARLRDLGDSYEVQKSLSRKGKVFLRKAKLLVCCQESGQSIMVSLGAEDEDALLAAARDFAWDH